MVNSPPICLQVQYTVNGNDPNNPSNPNYYWVTLSVPTPQYYSTGQYDGTSVAVGMWTTSSFDGYVFRVKEVITSFELNTSPTPKKVDVILEDVNGFNASIDPTRGIQGGAPNTRTTGYVFELNPSTGLPALTSVDNSPTLTFPDSVLARFLFMQTSPGGGTGIQFNQYNSTGGTGYFTANKGQGSTGLQYSHALALGPSIQTVFGASGDTGPSSNPTIFVNADILPTQDEVYNIGSRDFKFKTINLAAKTIFLGSSYLSTDSAGNVVITSSDGTSAVPSTNENFMLAVGDDTIGSIKYSTNGTTWTNAKTGPLGPSGSAPPFKTGLAVVWTGNIWLAGGIASALPGSSSILKSNNGREWFVPAITTDPFTQYGGQAVDGGCITIAYNPSQNRLVAGGNQGAEDYQNYNHIFYSDDDGNTWTPVSYTAPGDATGYARKVATDGKNTWYLIDIADSYGNGFPYTSSDGINWTLTNSTQIFGTSSIQYNGHYWLACGANNTPYDPGFYSISRSYDGITWTPVLSSIPDGVNQFNGSDIAWNGIYWVCVGRGAGSNLFTSQNGEQWRQVTDFVGINLNTIAWNGEIWVAGGSFSGAVDINKDPIPAVSFIVSYDTIDWYAVSGSAFTGSPIATASRRILPFGGSPPGSGSGPTGPVGPIQSIGFDGGNASSVYSMGPVFDCGRAQ